MVVVAPSIVFIKEMDAVGRERVLIKGPGGKEHDATLNHITTVSKSHTQRSGYIIRLKISAASESSSEFLIAVKLLIAPVCDCSLSILGGAQDINVASSIVEDISGDNALLSCQWWVGEFHNAEENYLVMDLWLIFPSLEDNWKSQKKFHLDYLMELIYIKLFIDLIISKATTTMMCMNCLKIQPVGPICSTPSCKWTYDGKILAAIAYLLTKKGPINISGGNMAMGGMEGNIKAKLKKTRKSIEGDKRCYLYGMPSPRNSKVDLSYEEPTESYLHRILMFLSESGSNSIFWTSTSDKSLKLACGTLLIKPC
ncbi:hypothetical protein Tco_0366662 [Tanacetum coccineum]